MMKNCYISGKISGLDEYEYQALFQCGEDEVKKLGMNPINPCKIEPYKGITEWKNYMIADITELVKCDAIYVLRNWKQSEGAKTEVNLALQLSIDIIFQK